MIKPQQVTQVNMFRSGYQHFFGLTNIFSIAFHLSSSDVESNSKYKVKRYCRKNTLVEYQS